jgi:phasin family protein
MVQCTKILDAVQQSRYPSWQAIGDGAVAGRRMREIAMGANETVKNIEVIAADAQKALSENMEKATKSIEEISTFGQETVDAMVKSQNVAAKAVEEFNAEVLAYAKKTLEETVAHTKDLASAQTVTEFFEKQAAYAKLSYDAFAKQTARMNEMVLAAVKQAVEPLSARMSAAADLMKAGRA